MFLERLSRIANRIEGAELLALVSADGIPVETVALKGKRDDLEVLAAEGLAQLQAMADNHREFGFGPPKHLTVATAEGALLLREIVRGYWLLLLVAQGTRTGRARYELRRARLDFEDDLI